MTFSTYELIVMRGEMLARLPDNRAFVESSPEAFKPIASQHVEAMESAIEKLNTELVSRGVSREGIAK